MARIRNQSAYNAEYYSKNRRKIRDEQRKWRLSVAGQRHRFARLLKRVGISAIDWAIALEKQRGLCAGCLVALDGAQNTHIDHCHLTGMFRGLLCSSCNLALGKVGDDPSTLRRLAEYLEVSRG
jgi:hypothetical protein